MAIHVELIIEYDKYVSFRALRDALDLIATSIEGSLLRVVHGPLLRDLGLETDFFIQAAESSRVASLDSFWLEEVAPGSSTFRGMISGAFMTFVAAFAGRATFDVTHDSEVWQRVQPRLVEIVNEVDREIVNYLENLPMEPSDDSRAVYLVEFVGDRIRIIVRPSVEQMRYVTDS